MQRLRKSDISGRIAIWKLDKGVILIIIETQNGCFLIHIKQICWLGRPAFSYKQPVNSIQHPPEALQRRDHLSCGPPSRSHRHHEKRKRFSDHPICYWLWIWRVELTQAERKKKFRGSQHSPASHRNSIAFEIRWQAIVKNLVYPYVRHITGFWNEWYPGVLKWYRQHARQYSYFSWQKASYFPIFIL